MQPSPLILETESPRPDSGWTWLLRLVLSPHLAVPWCGSLMLTLISPPPPSVTPVRFCLHYAAVANDWKWPVRRLDGKEKALCKGNPGPTELGPPSENQRKGPTDRLTCDLSRHLSAALTTPGLLSAILMFQHHEVSINPSDDFQRGAISTLGNKKKIKGTRGRELVFLP